MSLCIKTKNSICFECTAKVSNESDFNSALDCGKNCTSLAFYKNNKTGADALPMLFKKR